MSNIAARSNSDFLPLNAESVNEASVFRFGMSLAKALNTVSEDVKAEYELYRRASSADVVQEGCRIFEEKLSEKLQELDTLKNTLPCGYASKEELKGLKLGKKELKEQKSQNKKIEEKHRKEVTVQERAYEALNILKDDLLAHWSGLGA